MKNSSVLILAFLLYGVMQAMEAPKGSACRMTSLVKISALENIIGRFLGQVSPSPSLEDLFKVLDIKCNYKDHDPFGFVATSQPSLYILLNVLIDQKIAGKLPHVSIDTIKELNNVFKKKTTESLRHIDNQIERLKKGEASFKEAQSQGLVISEEAPHIDPLSSDTLRIIERVVRRGAPFRFREFLKEFKVDCNKFLPNDFELPAVYLLMKNLLLGKTSRYTYKKLKSISIDKVIELNNYLKVIAVYYQHELDDKIKSL